MTRWLTDEEQTTWQAYVRMRQRLDSAIAAGLAKDGLSYSDYEVLVALAAADGRLRAKELGAEICWDKSRLSKHLSRMAARGLVDRCQAAEDARGREIRLTEAGRAHLRAAAPNHVDLVRRLFIEGMSDGEAAAVRSLAGRVVAEAEHANESLP